MSTVLLRVVEPTTLPSDVFLSDFSGFRHLTIRADLRHTSTAAASFRIQFLNSAGGVLSMVGARETAIAALPKTRTMLSGDVQFDIPGSQVANNSLLLDSTLYNYDDSDVNAFFCGETISRNDSGSLLLQNLGLTCTSSARIARIRFEGSVTLSSASRIRLFGQRG